MTVETTLTRPPSRLTRLRPKIVKALPKGLPRAVAAFYAEGDGLEVALRGPNISEVATIVGLAAMFDGTFLAHQPIRRGDDVELSGRPFDERFFNSELEVDEPGWLPRLNRLLRLKLLASCAGESAELAIDFFDGATPKLYLALDARDAWRLDLSFADFVAWFSKLGTRRWYYAFLDRAAEQAMNVDLRAELEASLAPFPRAEIEPLLARFSKRKAAKPAARPPARVATPKKPAKLPKLSEWAFDPPNPFKEPACPARFREDGRGYGSLALTRDALRALALTFTTREDAAAQVFAGLERHFTKRTKWRALDHAGVLVAADALTPAHIIPLAQNFFEPAAFALLAREKGWTRATIQRLANETSTGYYNKKHVGESVPRILQATAKLLRY